jgi:predicted nucleic acid-binding protein
MNDREFVDTNVLIYAFDQTAGEKRNKAATLVERLWIERRGCVSIQVLQEFYVTAARKLAMPAQDAGAQIKRLARWTVFRPDANDVLEAVELHRQKKISFWDAMILRSAIGAGCSILWTEDLSTGQRWDGLVVRSPF